MNFEEQLSQWVSIDNKYKLLSEQMKEIRNKRNKLSEEIIKYASTNHLSNKNILTSDGKLKFINTKLTEPLTFKYLEKSLNEVIKNDSQVKLIMEYIKEKRNYKIVPEIKRFYNN
jgi:hypothetical protein